MQQIVKNNNMENKFLGELEWCAPIKPSKFAAVTPLDDPSVLLELGCHIDHEGFDLNEIEQLYYKQQGIALTHDPTLYKDGGGITGATAIIQPWCIQKEVNINTSLIVDHSQFVFRFPIAGAAREQIKSFIPQRPELARLLSTRFKCGLDLCIDVVTEHRVEPVVHIEWDYDNYRDLHRDRLVVEESVKNMNYDAIIDAILHYNKLARTNKVDAFVQADTRSQLLFGHKSYKLIPTL